jgi:hypothetical protein
LVPAAIAHVTVMTADAVSWIWVLLCFGALTVPLAYVLVSRFRGRFTRAMLIGGGIHMALILLVYGISDLDYRRGNTEAYYWVFLFSVLNLLGLIYYGSLLARCFGERHEES